MWYAALVMTRKSNETNKLGASAVYQMLERSRQKSDEMALHLAIAECAILDTHTSNFASLPSTQAMRKRYDM